MWSIRVTSNEAPAIDSTTLTLLGNSATNTFIIVVEGDLFSLDSNTPPTMSAVQVYCVSCTQKALTHANTFISMSFRNQTGAKNSTARNTNML
jgi:hypothetical protein